MNYQKLLLMLILERIILLLHQNCLKMGNIYCTIING